MALTNDQITAQNFKDFYNQIRPYLNGNVPTFANTFNKSDLYSTDEQLVGRWIDGKPLYQKVYNNIAISPSANELDVASLNIDNIISMSGKYVYNNDYVYNFSHVDPNGGFTYVCDLFFRKSTNKITFLIGSAINTGNVNNLIIQYTKTTDSSMSITDGNEYSTDEQVVGHWIDDSILYQKTFIIPVTNLTSVQQNLGSISGINFKDGFISDFYFFEEDYYLGMGDVSVWIRKPEQNFGFRATNTATRNGTAYVTVRYTKN